MAVTKAVKEMRALDDATKGKNAGDVLHVELIPGVSVGVLPPKMWRLSSFRKMRAGDLDGWAGDCLASAEDVAVLVATDPTMEQFEAFTLAVNEAAEALGK